MVLFCIFLTQSLVHIENYYYFCIEINFKDKTIMNEGQIFTLFLGVFLYISMIYAFSYLTTFVVETILYTKFVNSGGVKFNKLVNTLKLNETGRDEPFNYKQPLWYKIIQIFVGLFWPISFIIILVCLLCYYCFYFIPKEIYKYIILSFYYWITGKENV